MSSAELERQIREYLKVMVGKEQRAERRLESYLDSESDPDLIATAEGDLWYLRGSVRAVRDILRKAGA